MVAFGRAELSVREHRQAAAVLGRHYHFIPEMLQHQDRGHADVGFIVLGCAAVKIDYFALAAQPLGAGARQPAVECFVAPAGQGRLFCHTEKSGRELTADRAMQDEVRQSGRDASYLSQQLVAAQEPVSPGETSRCHDAGAGAGVDFGDTDACWADFITDTAAGAVVDRGVRHLSTGKWARDRAGGVFIVWVSEITEAFRLGRGVLGSREAVGHFGDRAVAGADVALDTVVQALANRIQWCGRHFNSRSEEAGGRLAVRKSV